MSRKRFTQIIDKTNNVIPVGGEAQNITLKDGSVLEEALGEINLAEKGSIMDQINELRNGAFSEQYAPLISPKIQRSFAVQQDYMSKFHTNFLSGTSRNITLTKSYLNSNTWSVSGIMTGETAGMILLIGANDNVSNVGSAGTYTYYIASNCISQGKTGIQFFWNNLDNTNNRESFVNEADMKPIDAEGINKQVKGKITIPSGCKLNRITFFLYAAGTGYEIKNGYVTMYLYKDSDDKDIYPFSITNSNDRWKTSVADNLEVKTYNTTAPRSKLGTIYDSSWESILRVKAINSVMSNNKYPGNGVLIEDSGVGFLLSTNSDKVTNRWSGVTSATDFRIFPGYDNQGSIGKPGVYYDSRVNHVFRTKDSDGRFRYRFLITPNDITLYKPTTITGGVTINGAASITGATTIGGDLTTKGKLISNGTLEINGKVTSSNLPLQVTISSMKEFEAVIENNDYPSYHILTFVLKPTVVYYLTKRKGGYKDSSVPSGISSCTGVGFKTSSNNILLFFVGMGKLFRCQYYWPESKGRVKKNNRGFHTFSIEIKGDELGKDKPSNNATNWLIK